MSEDLDMGGSEHPQAAIASLGTRVTNIETVMGSLGRKLDDVLALISARSQMNWTPILTAAGVITSILGLVGTVIYMPIKEAQTRAEMGLERLQSRSELAFDKVVARMELNDQQIKSQMVPRTEHELFWKQYEKTMDRVITRLDRLEYGSAGRQLKSELAKP